MSAAGGGGISISINSTANTSGVAAMQSALAGLDATTRSTSTSAGGVGETFTRSMGQAGEATSNFGSLFSSFAQGMAAHSRIGGALYQTSQFFQSFNDGGVAALTKGLGLLGGAFGGVLGVAESFIGNIATIVTSLGVFDVFSLAASKVRELSQEMMTLNETTQSQYVGWGYLFGNQNGPDFGASSQMLGWTAKESYNMPFTRQDMHSAISTLQTLGLPPESIQHYLPILADLAVRNPGITLDRIAMSVMGAQFGLTRMLRYDLRITPEQLQQFGLDFQDGKHIDPKTLLPALENYASSMGYYNPQRDANGRPIDGTDTGASYMLAHNTFAGASTSLTDRIQNILTELGGTLWTDQTNPQYNADLAKADALAASFGVTRLSRMDTAKITTASDANAHLKDLQDALAKDKKNSADADKLAADQKAIDDYLALFGGGISVRNIQYGMPGHEGEGQYIQKAFGEAGDVQKGTLFDMMINGLNAITNWWDEHQQDITKLADIFANLMGEGLKNAGNALVSFAEGLQESGIGSGILGTIKDAIAWLADPQHQQQIKDLAKTVGQTLGAALKLLGDDIGLVISNYGQLGQALGGTDMVKDLFFLAAGFTELNHQMNMVSIYGTELIRILIDAGKVMFDLQTGNLADLISSEQDMAQALIDGQMAIATANQQATDSYDQLAQALANYEAAQNKANAAANGATGPISPAHTGPTARQNALTIGGLGPTTSYGDTSHNYYIYGANGQQVQQIVNQSQTQQNQQALATARRPGGMRFRTFGLY